MARFEAGKWYWNKEGMGIFVTGRTEKFIKVKGEPDNDKEFRLKIHEDCGIEWVYDSKVPARWRNQVSFCALWDSKWDYR